MDAPFYLLELVQEIFDGNPPLKIPRILITSVESTLIRWLTLRYPRNRHACMLGKFPVC